MRIGIMIRLSYPLKLLLLATVISLLPVTLGVSPLDYKGASLEAAEEEKKKKKKTHKTSKQENAENIARTRSSY